MILYFDNLITNIPLKGGVYNILEGMRTEQSIIRNSCKAYSTKDRYDVTLYTLESYATIEWEEVIIVYELGKDIIHKKKEFEKFVKNLWPRAHIFYGRSDNQKKFQEKVKFINKLKGEFVFYAGNNDHPFIAPDKKTLNFCLRKAKELSKSYKYVSIAYSHFLELYRMGNRKSPYYKYMVLRPKIIDESKYHFTTLLKEVFGESLLILNKNLINQMVFSEDFGDEIFKRIEEIWRKEKQRKKRVDQILIIPKNPICGHFDGYSHTKKGEFPVPTETFPPLFIPNGFFKNKIKIRYGYNEYKEGWVNINPLMEKHKFEDTKNGTDMRISLEDTPLFWKKRISRIDINPNLDKNAIKIKMKEINKNMRTPHEIIEDKSGWYKLRARLLSGNYLPYKLMRFLSRNKTLLKIRRFLFFKLRDEFISSQKTTN